MPLNVSRESFLRETGLADVSRESLRKLFHYHALLEKWQRAVNLVSPSTLPDAWRRHFVDSAQIGGFLDLPQIWARKFGTLEEEIELSSPVCYTSEVAASEGAASEMAGAQGAQKITLFDFGSGGGFPGLVLAILFPDLLDVHLVESDQKKCSFMATVSRETKTPVSIHNVRIENLKTDAVPDIIPARALADLGMLLDFAAPWAAKNRELILVLPKGERFAQELEAARKKNALLSYAHCEEFLSKTDEKARILRISGLHNPVRNVN